MQLSLPWLFDLHEYALVVKKKAQRWETIPSLASCNEGIILSGWLLGLINNVELWNMNNNAYKDYLEDRSCINDMKNQ